MTLCECDDLLNFYVACRRPCGWRRMRVSLIRMLLFPDQLNVIAMRQESESTTLYMTQ